MTKSPKKRSRESTDLTQDEDDVLKSKKRKSETAEDGKGGKISDWKVFLERVILGNEEISETDLHEDSELFQSLTKLKGVGDAESLRDELCSILSFILKDGSNPVVLKAASLIYCCLVLDIKCLPEDIQFPPNLIPRHRSVEYEPILHKLLLTVLREAPDLVADVTRIEVRNNLSLVKVLQLIAKFIHDTSLPVPVTDISVKCVIDLINVSPLSVEPLIGSFCAIFLFNIDHVDITAFWKIVLDTFVKLRQIPKLIAKLLISVGKNKDLKVVPLSDIITHPLGEVFESLPLGQVREIMKTFSFHLKPNNSEPSDNMDCLLDDLMATFFNHVCILDLTKPKSALVQIFEILESIQNELKASSRDLKRSGECLGELAIALCHFRGLDYDNVVVNNAMEACEISKLCVDMDISSERETDFFSFATQTDDEDLLIGLEFLNHCQDKKLINLSKKLPELSPILAKRALEISRRLQAVFINETLLHLADILDVDSRCEEIFKPFVRKPKLLLQENNADYIATVLKKSFACLDYNLSIDMVNDDFSPTFYFSKPIEALKLLPLENLDPVLSNVCVIMTMTLISVCAHDEVNNDLLKVLARCFDTIGSKGPSFTMLLDPSRVLIWSSKIRYYSDSTYLVVAQKILTRLIVKNIKEFTTTFPNFPKNIDRLSLALKTLNNEKAVSAAVILMEALEIPLVHQDASDEKLDICKSHFQKHLKHLMEGLSIFDDLESKCLELALRGAKCFLSILAQNQAGYFKLKPSWTEPLTKCLSFCIEELSTEADVQFVIHAVKASQVKKEIFGDAVVDLKKVLWEKLNLVGNQKLVYELSKCLFESSSKEDLVKNLEFWSQQKVDKESFDALMTLSKALAISRLEEDHANIRQEFLEKSLGRLQIKCISDDQIESESIKSLLNLHSVLSKMQKPLVCSETESRIFAVCLNLNLEQMIVKNKDIGQTDFLDLWDHVCDVASSALLNRTNFSVIPRIPVFISVVKHLIFSLIRAGDQNLRLDPSYQKRLTGFAQNIDRLMDHIKRQKEDFARVAPYLIADVMEYFQKISLLPSIKTNLTFGLHKLLDICDLHSKEFLTANLKESQRELFKDIVNKYNHYYKYTGRV